MADDRLLAAYPRQPVVRDRNFSGLVHWAGYTASLPIPEERPTEDWVRLRIVAERLPTQAQNYVERTLSFFLQDPTTVTNIRQFLNPWNDEGTEVALSAQIEGIIGSFMPRFARFDVSDAQIDAWYVSHGFDAPGAPIEPAEPAEPDPMTRRRK
ncbi:MAG TPA: hypothetical protein VLN57_19450 [Xanthobacteraceae bacterium]|nr:hypothetical protein [Xanthobacteraceae bacterium]